MSISIRSCFALLPLLAAMPAAAQQADAIAAVRSDRWADAQRAASSYADPVANKLVTYFRLLAPGAATADEITDFMAQNPDWPNQALLERRRQEAIATDPDLASTLAQCERNQLILPQTMLHCAEAQANAGHHAAAAEEARHAWISGIVDQAGEAAFLRR
jgi:soluble lytic murein transglycosylase